MATGLRDDAVDFGQPESLAAPRLGREERLEDTIDLAVGNSTARIGDGDPNVRAAARFRLGLDVLVVQHDRLDLDRQPSAESGRFAGVAEQLDHDSLDLLGLTYLGDVTRDDDRSLDVARNTDRAEPAGPGRRRPVKLTSFDARPVDAVSFGTQRELLAERDRMRAAGLRVFESDVKPHDRYLMERFITGSVIVTGLRSVT